MISYPSISVSEKLLHNGCKLLVSPHGQEDLVSVQVWVRTGSIHEDDHLGKGLSHFVEHMIFKGTRKRHYSAIAQEVQSLGGSINAYTSFDRTVYYIEGPSEATEQFLEILYDIVFHSTFPEDEFPKEKDVILREIDMVLDDPDRELSQAVFNSVYHQHPFKYPVIGHKDLFTSITRNQLWEYYQERYIPNNSFVVVAGKIEPTKVYTHCENLFGTLERKSFELPSIHSEPPQMLARTRKLYDAEAQVVRGSLAFPIPGNMHPEGPALRALSMLLGQGESSILYNKLHRELGLAHYIQASCWNPSKLGIFWIQFGCDIGKEGQLVEAIFQEIQRLAEQNDLDHQIEKIRKQIQVADINSLKTVGGVASKIAGSEFLIHQQGLSNLIVDRIHQVDSKQIIAVADNYLRPEKQNLITLGPGTPEEDIFQETIKQRQPVYTGTLSNGIRVCLLKQSILPKVHIRGVMLGGSQLDPVGKSGLGSLSIHLMTQDTDTHSAQEIADTIEYAGAVFEESVGRNTMGLTLECFDSDLPALLPVFANGFIEPSFKEETFRIQRDSQIAQIKEELDEIFERGQRALRPLLFPDHPLGNDLYGEIKTLESLTAQDCRAYYQQIAKAENTVISVCGNFDQDEMLALLEKAFAKFPHGQELHPFMPVPEVVSSKNIVSMDKEQSVVFCAFPEEGILSDDYLVGELLDEIFSGMSSRLFETVREERGLAYYVGTSRSRAYQGSAFIFYAGTHPDKTGEVFSCIWDEIHRAKAGGLTENELAAAKLRMVIRGRKSRQSIGAYAAQMALNTLYGQPVAHWRTLDERLEKIELNDLTRFANKYFDPSRAIELTVGKSQ